MDPKRLTEQGNTFEQELLRSGLRDSMPEQSGHAILSGLGLTSPAAAGGVVAASAKVVFVKSVFVIATVGAAGLFAVWGGQRLFAEPAPSPRAAASELRARAPAQVPRPSEAPQPVTLPAPAKPEAPRVSVREDRPKLSPRVDTLPLELEALDQAKSALARGDHALASRLLDRYAARFSKPRLRTEATVLRIETLALRGDLQGARRIGTAFLANNPSSPYARRLRSLIGDSSRAAPGSAPSLGSR